MEKKDNEFLASLHREGQITPAAEPEKKDETPDPSAPPADKKEGEDGKPDQAGDQKPEGEGQGEKKPDSDDGKGKKPEDEKPLPFHQHPRWIAMQQQNKELLEFRDKVTPLLDELGKPKQPSETDDAMPDWFVELFGENQAAWKKYRTYNDAQRKQLREEIRAEFQQQAQASASENAKYDKWVASELTTLEAYVADNKLPKFERNELLKVALDYKPTDDEGRISFIKAYEILQAVKATKTEKKPDPKPNATDDKKKVADKTMGKDGAAGGAKDYKTSADLQGKSFRDIAANAGQQ